MRRELSSFWKYLTVAIGIFSIIGVLNQMFNLSLSGSVILESAYLELMLGFYLPLAFILYSPSKKGIQSKVPFYDILLALVSAFICFYFAYHGIDILDEGWSFSPPNVFVQILCVVLPFLLFEALRRSSGYPLLCIVIFFFFYPTISSHMPGFLKSVSIPFLRNASFHSLSPASIIGLPLQVVVLTVIGYILMGVILMETGGGVFFLNLASSLFGRFRGGTAKVSIVASGLFGSMSGAVIPNILTTGAITIPAMKRAGFPPHYAAAIEACASSGGTLMPPIMGAAAFLMATFLEMPYFTIVIAAIVPSFLYYLTLYIQIDSLSARMNISGIPVSELPPIGRTLKKGWYYIFALVILVFFLYLRATSKSPIYASIFLLAVAIIKKENRLNFQSAVKLIYQIAATTCELVVILAAVGIIVGSLALTGIGSTFPRELIALAGGNTILMLIFGAMAAYILGMGMTTSACYIFLAIVLAPGLIENGLNRLAVHFFILYWGMVSYITPPVALASFPAASIAKTSAGKVGITSMMLGFVKYFLPFIMVLSPEVIFQGTPLECVYRIILVLIGTSIIAVGLGRFLAGVGNLSLPFSALIVFIGFLIAFPLGVVLNISALIFSVILYAFIKYYPTKFKLTNNPTKGGNL